MKVTIALFALFMLSTTLSAEKVAIDGQQAGVYTMDYTAALAAAKAQNKPIFIDFTGSDWCYWCKLMQSNVFTKAAWSEFAKKELILVTIDFPQDESIVPEKYRARNQKLQNDFKIQGYPTYVILAADGKTELARLGAGQNKTVDSFIKEVRTAIAKK